MSTATSEALYPARFSPTTFSPFASTSNPEYRKNGGTSLFTRVLPPIIASRPIFENWWITTPPEMNAWSSTSTYPATSAQLQITTLLPIRQLCAMWPEVMM